jgi:hypothetical protein
VLFHPEVTKVTLHWLDEIDAALTAIEQTSKNYERSQAEDAKGAKKNRKVSIPI